VEQELVDLAKVGTAATNGQQRPPMPSVSNSPVNLASHPKVAKALRLVTCNPPDRSEDAFRVLCACYDAGLTPAQTEQVLRRRPDPADWLDENPPDELDRTWGKIAHNREDRQGERVDNLFDGDPIPLASAPPIPPFPTDALPPVIAAMVSAVAESTQTDRAMAGTCALSVLSAAPMVVRRGFRLSRTGENHSTRSL
jgi:hypothetical protein